MPSHTHSDSGHRHYIDLNSQSQTLSLFSLHGTNDEKKYSKDSSGGIAEDMDPSSQSHYHMIQGDSNMNFAQISNTGGDGTHENRQPYYVVAYIIFLG